MPLFGAGLRDVSVEELKVRSAQNDVQAMVELASRIFDGQIMPFDQAFVLKAFTLGAENGFPRAYTGLADCHAMGIGMQRDNTKVAALLQKAADAEDPLGMFRMGVSLFDGDYFPRDREKGLALIRKSSAAGCVNADALLARLALTGLGVPKDRPAALAQLKSLAEEKGCADAAVFLGEFHRGTIDTTVKKDLGLAKKYFLIAAKTNHAAAFNALGDMEMAKGGWEGKKAPRQEGAKWYRQAIARNSAEGMRKLGLMQMRDTLVRKPGEDWYQLLLNADRLFDDTATLKLALINYHAPGYLFRDLDWTKTAHFDQVVVKNSPSYQQTHESIHRLLEIYYEGGHGLDRDFVKCLEIAQPHLGDCEMANAYAGRILLHPDLPMGATREHIIRGYACLLKNRLIRAYGESDNGLWRISDEALFVLRSRHAMTREEVARAEQLVRDGFPNSETPLLP